MDERQLRQRTHTHVFGQDTRRPGERRTMLVIALTAATMLVEISAGVLFGSMALLADGLHMASHTVALGITAFAYVYARRHARDTRFSFGTGKVNALGGFAGALLLAIFGAGMAVTSLERLAVPVPIAFDQAIVVAVIGLLVNGVSVLLLGDDSHGHAEGHPGEHGHHHGGDYNLRSAYLHVLADALTSLLAIAALLAGKYLGLNWMDPLMGLVGAALVARWSYGLLRDSAATLLDRQAPAATCNELRAALEGHGDCRVADLHLWSIGPALRALEVSVITGAPLTPDEVRDRIPRHLHVAHATIEVHRS